MGMMQSIYNASPRVLRSLYVNVYGVNNVLRRRRWETLLRQAAPTERMDRERQVELVADGLKTMLRHAFANVPFYGKYAKLASDLDTRGAYRVLAELPVVDKSIINREPEAFLSRTRGKCVVSRTSGTTGTPFYVHVDRQSFLLGDALWWRRTQWAGYRPTDWIARLVGDPIVPLDEREPDRPWMISLPERRIYLSTFHLTEKTAAAIGDLLRRRRPAYVMGYPSSLGILCRYLQESGFEMDWDLRHVLFSSEPMHAHQEQVIRQVLKAEIRGLYGSGEKVVSAAQCEAGNYHLSLVDGYMEGQFGILPEVAPAAVTTLTNTAMPLIRYQIGDVVGTRPHETCPCGRTLPMISPVITKHEDDIITPSGRRISSSAVVWAFIHQEISDIRKAQVIQEDERRVTLLLDADEDTFRRYRDLLAASLRKMFFDELDVEVVRTDQIEVTQAGKSRFIVNKLGSGR